MLYSQTVSHARCIFFFAPCIVALTLAASARAQTKFQAIVVVDESRRAATATGCSDGIQVNTLEVLADRIRKTASDGKTLDLFFAEPRQLGRATPLRSVTVPSSAPNVNVTYSGYLAADGIPDVRSANNKYLCAWRFKIL